MKMRASRSALAALGLALSVTLAGASFAQQRAPQPTPLPAPPQTNQIQPRANAAPDRQFNQDRRGDRRADRRGNRGDRVERRLDFLHYELRITQAQQRLWDNFAAVMRDEAQTMRGRGALRNGTRQDGSVIERLERRQDRLADRGERLDHLMDTVRPLYTALNAEQKRTADRLLLQAGNRGNRGFGRGGAGRGRGEFGRGRFGQGGFEGRRFGQNESGRFETGEPDEREYR